VVAFLRQAGHRVVCIDQKPVHGEGAVWTSIPEGAENQTGDRPLSERANWIAHAEFFIGLSSGLAWLAWALGRPVVLISGFTHPTNEFQTPFRVINYHACNSCWNDARVRFEHGDFSWRPRHKGGPCQFECSRSITASQVEAAVARIPGFGLAHRASGGGSGVGRRRGLKRVGMRAIGRAWAGAARGFGACAEWSALSGPAERVRRTR